MKASRFLYMIGGALITAGLASLYINPWYLLMTVVGIAATFVATGLDQQGC